MDENKYMPSCLGMIKKLDSFKTQIKGTLNACHKPSMRSECFNKMLAGCEGDMGGRDFVWPAKKVHFRGKLLRSLLEPGSRSRQTAFVPLFF